MDTDRVARLGILMLDTQFPRLPGDVGNPATWDFPVRYARVPGATPGLIVEDDEGPFFSAFAEAGRSLIAQGCSGIATTCGFLAPFRHRLAEVLGVPVAASALEQAGLIQGTLPKGRRLGILTISRSALSDRHLAAAEVPAEAAIAGMDGTDFAQQILQNRLTLDPAAAKEEMIRKAAALCAAHPDVGALLLECTNMGPYATAVALATGRPVYSIVTYLNWFHASLSPPAFEAG